MHIIFHKVIFTVSAQDFDDKLKENMMAKFNDIMDREKYIDFGTNFCGVTVDVHGNTISSARGA